MDHARKEVFVPAVGDNLSLEEYRSLWEQYTSNVDVHLDLTKFLKFLPKLEAEIFWLFYEKKKNQKDIAVLLGLSQSTISYRCRRALEKLEYLVILTALDVDKMVSELDFLNVQEKAILLDLLFMVHQAGVGVKHGVSQSHVKWVFVKTRRRLEKLEREYPKWVNHLGMIYLLERHLGVRVHDGTVEENFVCA